MAAVSYSWGILYKTLFTLIGGIIVKWLNDTRRQNRVCEDKWNVWSILIMRRKRQLSLRYTTVKHQQSVFHHRWPWALDLVKRHVGTVLTDHALMLQVRFTEGFGLTFAAYMFDRVGYFTSDPRDIKAITETRFQGTSLLLLNPFWPDT